MIKRVSALRAWHFNTIQGVSMNPMQSVSAVQYEIKVYEGMNDFAHGGGHMV